MKKVTVKVDFFILKEIAGDPGKSYNIEEEKSLTLHSSDHLE